jgi:hypothetical protein
MAEADDLKSSKCGFDPHRGHHASKQKLAENLIMKPTKKESNE